MVVEQLADANQSAGSPPAGSRLEGPLLWLARVLWALAFFFIAALFAANLPDLLIHTRLEWTVQEIRPLFGRDTAAFLNFVRYLVILRGVAIGIFFAVALIIAWRRSDDWLALFVSAVLPVLAFIFILRSDVDRMAYPGALLTVFPEIDFWFPPLAISCFLLLFFFFPSGRVTPRWLLIFLPLPIAATFLFFYAGEYGTFWFRETGWRRWIVESEMAWLSWGLILLSGVLAGLVGQFWQYRRAGSTTQKQQMRWVLFGLSGLLLPILLGFLLPVDGMPVNALVNLHLGLLSQTLLPLAIGIAILRYRLWEIDIVLNRALVYGGLTALLLAVYGLTLGGLAALFQTQVSAGLAVLATGVVAVAAQPLHFRLQRAVDRLMYGNRGDPIDILARLGDEMEAAASPTELLPRLARTIAVTLKLPHAGIWIRQGDDRLRPAALYGPESAAVLTLPLTHLERQVGQLVVGQRGEDESFTAGERRLLAALARHIGSTVYAARLAVDLQQSREKLVLTREEERRRLRRDLHDGLGPRLATMTLQVDTARNLLRGDLPAAENQLHELKGQIQQALQDIRRLVYELRPPALDQFGLVAALEQHAGSSRALQTIVETAGPLPRLPAAVEVAAYRIAVEAMTNVLRHAHARHCTVRLSAVEEALLIEIEDDGHGLGAGSQGTGIGLASMRERASELGGSFSIEGGAAGGTRVRARLPLPNNGRPVLEEKPT